MTINSQDQKNTGKSASPMVSVATDIVAVLLSATLLVLPIENGGYWPFAFVPILLRMWTRSYLSIFILGFATFFLYLFYTLQWIDSYGFHWRVALVFMNALMPGAAFVIGFWLLRRYRLHFYATVFPTIFVLLDFKQTLGFLGFPWPILCHSQAGNLPLIQIASITGCWGVTWLLMHVNEALAHLIAGGFKTRVLPIGIAPLVLIGACGLYGALRLAGSLPEATIQATLVQWDESTNVQWTAQFNRRSIDAYSDLTISELTVDPAVARLEPPSDETRLVIWPETGVPDATRDFSTLNRIRMLADAFNASFVVGCLTWSPGDGVPLDLSQGILYPENPGEYNTMVAFDPDGRVIPIYSKLHLVPFGEVIPLKGFVTKWFPEYPWGAEDVSPGTGFHVVETQAGTVGTVVCYESFFPQIARTLVANGAQILVLGSNTSWFGRTRASFQHARFDTYRAVENGIYFCRAATTGISSVIDPQGRVLAQTGLFEADAITVPIGLRTRTTLYTRWGDWIPAMCGIYFLLMLLGAFLAKEEIVAESQD